MVGSAGKVRHVSLVVVSAAVLMSSVGGGPAGAQTPVSPPSLPSPAVSPPPAAPTITAGPCGATGGCALRTQAASFAFHSKDPGASFVCRLQGPVSRTEPCGSVQDWAVVEASPAMTTGADAEARAQGFVPPGQTGAAAAAAAAALQVEAAPLPDAASGDATAISAWAPGAVQPHAAPSPGAPGAAMGAATDVAGSAVPAAQAIAEALMTWWTPTVPAPTVPNTGPATDMAGGLGAAVGVWVAGAPQPGGWAGPATDPIVPAAQNDAVTVQGWSGGSPSPDALTVDDAAGAAAGAASAGAAGDAGTAGAWAGQAPPPPTPDAALAVATALVDSVGGVPAVDAPSGPPAVTTDEVDVVTAAAADMQAAAATDGQAAQAFAADPVAVDTKPPALAISPAAATAAGAAAATATKASQDAPAAATADKTALTPAAPTTAVPPDTSTAGAYTLKGKLPDGRYTFTVVAQRSSTVAGETSQANGVNQSAPATYVWFIDRTAPAAPTLAAKPDATTWETDAHFEFLGSPNIEGEPAGTFACAVDHQPAAPCGSTLDMHNLALGEHHLEVVETDAAGNIGAAATYRWVILPHEPPPPPRPPPPTPDPTVTPSTTTQPTKVLAVNGTVLVTPPGGTRRALAAGQGIPAGSTVDARHGSLTVAVTADGTSQRVELSGARFVYRLARDGARRLVAVTLAQPGSLQLVGRRCLCRVSTPDAVVLGNGSVSWTTSMNARGTTVRALAGRVSVDPRHGCPTKPIALTAARRTTFVPRTNGPPGRRCS